MNLRVYWELKKSANEFHTKNVVAFTYSGLYNGILVVISINVSRALCRETPNRRQIYYIKAGETIREGQVPCVSFHVQKVQVCGFMYLRTNHWLSVGTAGAKSEAGEHNVGGTTESQP